MSEQFLQVSELDFDSIRSQIKTFLQSQSQFADYNFDGSNLAVFLDILAYNTYINAFYLNMVGSEMFLDTAQIRDSVVSHAKELNYLPRSYRSASATVSLNVAANTALHNITVPKHTKFTSTTSEGTFTFYTSANTVIDKNANNQFVDQVTIYEGFIVTEAFVVDKTDLTQRFVLSNPQVDTSSIEVVVQQSPTDTTQTTYSRATTLYGYDSTSTIYFVEPAEDGKYLIAFGRDDVNIGKPLVNRNVVLVTYRVSSGDSPNGSNRFSLSGTINGASATVTTVSAAAGGAEAESVASIKYNAPRHFQTQQRGVTVNDYTQLITQNFPTIRDVYVFGGEELPPALYGPQYGRVYVSATTEDGNEVSDLLVNEIKSYLSDKRGIALELIFTQPEYLYIQPLIRVTHDQSVRPLTVNGVRAIVEQGLTDYNADSLGSFDTPLRYSRFVSYIDQLDTSFVSNATELQLYKIVVPNLNISETITVDFGNALEEDDDTVQSTIDPTGHEAIVWTTAFTYNGKTCYIQDDGNGTLYIYQNTSTGKNILVRNAGSVDYQKGIITLQSLVITGYSGSGIKFYGRPVVGDVLAVRNNILLIDVERTSIISNAVRL